MRRIKEQIIADILSICLNGCTKTAVVHRNNLNFETANRYLDSLVQNGFLTVVEGSPSQYKTTDKGKVILGRLKKIHEIL